MKQLTVLGDAGVIISAKAGRTVRHALDDTPLTDYSTWLATRRTFWQGQLSALDAAVALRG
jgi:hypothetical protein